MSHAVSAIRAIAANLMGMGMAPASCNATKFTRGPSPQVSCLLEAPRAGGIPAGQVRAPMLPKALLLPNHRLGERRFGGVGAVPKLRAAAADLDFGSGILLRRAFSTLQL